MLALAGCDKLTISPALLEEMSNSTDKVGGREIVRLCAVSACEVCTMKPESFVSQIVIIRKTMIKAHIKLFLFQCMYENGSQIPPLLHQKCCAIVKWIQENSTTCSFTALTDRISSGNMMW